MIISLLKKLNFTKINKIRNKNKLNNNIKEKRKMIQKQIKNKKIKMNYYLK